MTTPAIPWSTRLALSPESPESLTGDKIHLPQSALEQLLSAAQTLPRPEPEESNPWARPAQPQHAESLLPSPLILRLTNPATKISTYAVPREFSAEEDTVAVSPFLRKALGIHTDEPVRLEVEAATLPKGTSVKLRPLEAGYGDEDWEPILENYLRGRFATISEGLVLEVPRDGLGGGVWRFLVDKAEPGGSVCVIDTDLALVIEAMDEDQARETLRRREAEKEDYEVVELEKEVTGEIVAGEERFFTLQTWDRTKPLDIELDSVDCAEGEDVDIFITTDRQQFKPRHDQHIWGSMSTDTTKRLTIAPTNVELTDARTIHLCLRGWQDPFESSFAPGPPRRFTLRISQIRTPPDLPDDTPRLDTRRCPHCLGQIPTRSLPLHEAQCARLNLRCNTCGHVTPRAKAPQHTHCALCTHPTNTPAAADKHHSTTHTPLPCPGCDTPPAPLPRLALHRATSCPATPHICSFCHLLLPRGPASPESTLSGLSAHELSCGARTAECPVCARRVRLRDLALHRKHHDLTRLSRPPPLLCVNPNCCRAQAAPNPLALCEQCYGGVYAPGYDPEGTALRRRVERRLLKQLTVGCGRVGCGNAMCAMRAGAVGMREAAERVREVLAGAALPLCVDRRTEEWRALAERLAVESAVGEGSGGFELPWCVLAVEKAGGDVEGAWRWLEKEGVRVGEREPEK